LRLITSDAKRFAVCSTVSLRAGLPIRQERQLPRAYEVWGAYENQKRKEKKKKKKKLDGLRAVNLSL
jgi:hypothetical protein